MFCSDTSKTLLVVYHSQSGRTELLARDVVAGARNVDTVSVVLAQAAQVNEEALMNARVLVICSPEYFGYMAGAIKDLFDRTYERVRDYTTGKPYAVVITAGNDGSGALQSIERIIRGFRMRKVQDPVMVRGPISPEYRERCRELGHTLAAGIELGIY